MADEYKTEQEAFWAGGFGDEYVARINRETVWSLASRIYFYAQVLGRTRGVTRILELGANVGENLLALRNLVPQAEFGAVEINMTAVELLKKIPRTKVFPGSMLEVPIADLGKYDLTMISGVLIHIDPDHLHLVYERLYECATKYVLVIEYYNPTPVEVTYRGHEKKLFKRDFAGDMLDKYPDLELVDYGFQYRRDNNYTADDTTWFLMRKTKA